MSGPQHNVGCLGRLVQVLFGRSVPRNDVLASGGGASGGGGAYRRKKYLLSRAELDFYRELLPIAAQRGWTICPKVNLNDLLFLAKGTQERMSWLNRINRKHADFVVCDAGTMSPLLVIELDDASHANEDAKSRDAVKDGALQAAGFPLLRVPARRSYTLEDIGRRIQGLLDPE